jgi:hypothetical protein
MWKLILMAAVVLRATLSLGDEPYHQIASMGGVFVERSWELWQGEGGGKNYFFRVNNTNDFDVMITYQIARRPPAMTRWGAHEKSVLETYDTQGAAPRFLLINVKAAGAAETEGASEANSAIVVDPDGWTNLRENPSTESKIKGRVKAGTEVGILYNVGKWYLVMTPSGLNGFGLNRFAVCSGTRFR